MLDQELRLITRALVQYMELYYQETDFIYKVYRKLAKLQMNFKVTSYVQVAN